MSPTPLILLVLIAAYGLFGVAAAGHLLGLFRGSDRRRGAGNPAWAALAAAFVAAVAALLLSPVPPVVCTYTGLSHVTTAYHIAHLEWLWPFPTDYPLAVPTLAALFVRLLGRTPEAFGFASLLLHALSAAAVALLAARLWPGRLAAWFAGLLGALTPLALLYARGDGLSVGYAALSAWAVLFALEVLQGGGRLARLGLAAATVLVVQSRPEALAFPLVLVALVPALSWPDLRPSKQLLAPLGGALLALLPYLARFAGEFLGADRSLAMELGLHMAWKHALSAAFIAGGILFMTYGVAQVGRLHRLLFPALLFGTYLAALVLVFGVDVLGPGTHCWGREWETACHAQTWKTVAWWVASPKLVPLGAVFLALAGLFSFRSARDGRVLAWLVLWAGGIVAAASTKMTGELPYEGARTQLPALVPVLLLAGAGVAGLLGTEGRRGRIAALSAGLVTALTLAPPMATVARFGFDEQAEFAFVREVVRELPRGSTVYLPDDILSVRLMGDDHDIRVDLFHLYRSAYLAEALGDAGEGVRMLAVGAADRSAPGPRYFLRSLNCYRTGVPEMTPSCQRALARPGLVPVREVNVANRPYTSDFFEQTRVLGQNILLGLYALPGAAEDDDAVP